MYSEGAGLKTWTGLQIADAALLAVTRARKCALCDSPRPPKGLLKYDKLAVWAARMHDFTGASPVTLKGDERCPVCEADLKPVVGIPDDILVFMHRRLSERQRAFLETRFVLAVCESCRKVNRDLTERDIRDHYKVAVNHHGAVPADDGLVEEIFGLVAQEINYAKQGYGASAYPTEQ
jgi:hypothetical protein